MYYTTHIYIYIHTHTHTHTHTHERMLIHTCTRRHSLHTCAPSDSPLDICSRIERLNADPLGGVPS